MTINSLPSDVLLVVLSLVPIGQRLRIASCVCRRWRDMVRRSISSLSIAYDYLAQSNRPLIALDKEIAAFPSLTDLTLRSNAQLSFSAPSCLRRLCLEPVDLTTETFIFTQPLPSLASLSCPFIGDGFHALALLQASRSTLTSLEISSMQLDKPPKALKCDHYPSLTSLTVHCGPGTTLRGAEGIAAHMRLHAGQLTFLSLYLPDNRCNFAPVVMPLVSTSYPSLLTLELHPFIPEVNLWAVLDRCSKLQTFNTCSHTVSHLLEQRPPMNFAKPKHELIKKVYYRYEDFDYRLSPESLTRLSQLQQIKGVVLRNSKQSLSFMTSLVDLNLSDRVSSMEIMLLSAFPFRYALSNFTLLEKLVVAFDSPSTLAVTPHPPMPRLRKLEVRTCPPQTEFSKLVEFIRQFAHACPELSAVCADVRLWNDAKNSKIGKEAIESIGRVLYAWPSIVSVRLTAGTSFLPEVYAEAKQVEAKTCARIGLIVIE